MRPLSWSPQMDTGIRSASPQHTSSPASKKYFFNQVGIYFSTEKLVNSTAGEKGRPKL